ncbi:bifunctional [glutamate--ammonia ligase]-adenylyl-L-tyrosine phosphorylase/[glutamate--ammonia-ligase] adenylyltransferase [Ramlibacter sp.]|uniref:bifunctional [glutamate--ammonia ligase]-adenylyl-L-tyrosine phosphorylase/[glutamate--ammonia-ligase] adenylyltransferase n=1 Tax=Ramlibacter sp. TaxID=1917967 RepID=UPI00260BC1D3|nr:bifunctional [glutamate--ammonia ligase]-adenylyl-L-tyrosine phosphorylase/[glutamate--ammonia-ligase] adenylyltransferase [Ramlibacter sp.]MDB5954997.1 glutamate-ammonia-ligase adenylyltransferase (Glutamine-synthetase adenylyltransferase)-like protein [Ramlibacter sp.]
MTLGAAPGSAKNEIAACDNRAAAPGVQAAAGQIPLAGHSRLVQRLRRRYDSELSLLPAGAPNRDTMDACYQALRSRGHEVAVALRVLRQLVMERLVVLDCEERAPLATVTSAVTELAEFALDAACLQAFHDLDQLHGAPLTAEGQRAQLWVIGMGKLGARELNVSSDVDLVYIFDQDGETAGTPQGRGRITNHEYFGKAVKCIFGLIGDVTEHGFVFRVDLALRPNGNSGPPAVSLDALEDYFLVQGREWERFAWMKSRVVAPRNCIEDGSAQALRGAVLPFVFRRYLDYAVFDALRTLHRQIREHAARRAAGRPERANDVKLSRGGIREIEFTVQLLQVVRGGQFPELRTRPTLQALERLAVAGLMSDETAQSLAAAYTFLRRVEHRIQYLDDQQTHVLPMGCRDDDDGSDLSWIAHTMGYADCSPFLHELDGHRELVAQEFDKLLGGGAGECRTCNGPKGAKPPPELDTLIEYLPAQMQQRIKRWCTHPRVLALRDDARHRLSRLIARTGVWLQEGRVSEEAALRMADWIEPLLRRESYLALLWERPSVHERLLRLLGAARWPARYLIQHPGVIDELASDALLSERFNAEDFERELEHRKRSVQITGEDDDETMLNLLRRAHHAELFRTLARDVEGALTVEQVADELSALADATLNITARWCWQRLKQRHRETPLFAILGYGKLGGKELGYGSDLDIVFVYEDDDERAPDTYAAFVRKIINWLSTKTAEGDLFEIDTALRPNGSSGLLITTFHAFANYQEGRGSNTAWTWEHQAMTRARFVVGLESLRPRFDTVRQNVISAERDVDALKREIVAMREKVRQARPVKEGHFDLKHSPGGMVDAEFAVQFLVLAHSARHAELIPNVGNIALLQRAEAAGLLPQGVGQEAASAYRELRRHQHQARLNEESTQVPQPQLQHARAAILDLWQHVFG